MLHAAERLVVRSCTGQIPSRRAAASIVLAVTEIPEHLLKRSQAAKAKAAGDEGASAAGAASAPETVEGAAPATTPSAPAVPSPPRKAAPAAPPPPKPDPPHVAAAKNRMKIPFWAMATLSILPLWVFMYARSLTPADETVAGPLGDGAEIYAANCSSCHGGSGEGGVGYPLAGGEVLLTFPHIEDQVAFVYSGTVKYANAGITVYGDPEREGGVHATGATGQMPPQGAEAGGGLTEAQILAVVCHERYTVGGADPTGADVEEYERWCSPESEVYIGLEDTSITFTDVADDIEGVLPIGTAPRAAQPADATP